LVTRFWSPAQFNSAKFNPLRDILVRHVDFGNVCHCQQMKVFVAATNVETGQVKIFDRTGLTADMVMASACLPFLFEAVEIDGVPYWDGGYSGNPPLLPLYRESGCSDIVIVQINPITRSGTPRSAQEIRNRMNEITFNTSLLKELRTLDFIKRLLAEGALNTKNFHEMRLHLIECEDELKPLGASSKLNAEWAFLSRLRTLGRRTASHWLDRNFEQIGLDSSIDLGAMSEGIERYG
jgi:NTE family protein